MSKFCPSCGEELVDSAKFCKNCGTNLENGKKNEFVENKKFEVPVVEKSYKISIIVGYVCAVLFPLIGLIIGIYLVTRKDSQNAKRHAKFIIIVAVLVWIFSALFMRY